MPICNKTLPESNSSKSAAEVDDHASEAAKMKRTREQAYFNSYDFDAIEVLPYESEEEDEGGEEVNKRRRQRQLAVKNFSTLPPPSLSPNSRHRRLQQQTTTTISRKISNSTSSGTESSSSSSLGNDRMKISYLQRLGNFLSSHPQHPAAIATIAPEQNVQHLSAAGDNSSRSDCSQSSCDDIAGKGAVCKVRSESSSLQQLSTSIPTEPSDGGNFLLPRAILKYQSSGVGSSNSMPLAVISATTITTAAATTHTGTSKSLQNANNINTTNRQNNAINSSKVATILRPNKFRQNQQSHLNSNEIGTGFQIAIQAGKSATLVRNKKNSASSTTTASTLTLATSTSASASTSSTRSVELIVSENAILPTNGGNTTKLTKMVKTTTTTGPTAIAATVAATAAASTSKSKSTHGEQRECVSSHQSHYSTDKSGSSGYYSSNVCSTYSIEDHIYCEPVIDILDLNSKSKSVLTAANKTNIINNNNKKATSNSGSNNNNKPIILDQSETLKSSSRSKIMNGGAHQNTIHRVNTAATEDEEDCDDDDDDDDDEDVDVEAAEQEVVALDNQVIIRTLKRNPAPPLPPLPPTQIPHFSENLRILETSIENLDRHLKAFPNLTSQDRITSFVQATHHQQQHQQHLHHHHGYMQHGLDERFRAYPHHHLPTIMEAYDPANSPTPRAWQDIDMADDSLLDIDLDSFLLVNERGTLGKRKTKALGGGIDNPSFIAEELEENNYKCAKYINSCPEDAYRVESDIVAGGTASQKSASMEHYLKRYEDQIHFQNTRELLEDVRDKIRLLSRSRNELRSSSESSQSGSAGAGIGVGVGVHPVDEELPKELDGMIKTLKLELEAYLQRMNQHSELEIRQLCSGLVKNQHIVKMKKAFERRRSIASISALESDYDFSAYEAIRDGEIIAASAGVRQQVMSIRCASDPNFKMKRKSLTEVFPAADFYIENVGEVESQHIVRGALVVNQTQLQRNLSFQQPILNNLDTQVVPNGIGNIGGVGGDSGLTNSGRSSGSGGESGEKDSIMEWHRNKPSIWEMYYGTNRMNQSLLGKRGIIVNTNQAALSYPSSRPESDFTLDLPRAEQLRIKMEKEKKFRQRCRYITSFLSLIFFLLTVMVVSLVLTRGKRMFGSMI